MCCESSIYSGSRGFKPQLGTAVASNSRGPKNATFACRRGARPEGARLNGAPLHALRWFLVLCECCVKLQYSAEQYYAVPLHLNHPPALPCPESPAHTLPLYRLLGNSPRPTLRSGGASGVVCGQASEQHCCLRASDSSAWEGKQALTRK